MPIAKLGIRRLISAVNRLMVRPVRSKLAWGQTATLKHELAACRARLAEYERHVPPGSYYSPIPNLNEVRAREKRFRAH